MKKLNAQTYLKAFKIYGIGITGGTIHQFLRDSEVVYYGGKCPVYQVEYTHNGTRAVIGGNYATNGKPELKIFQELDF